MECSSTQDLCSITRGNTVEYDFTFVQDSGDPVDISGMTMSFSMKLKDSSPDGGKNDLYDEVTFPAGSTDGTGNMQIAPEKTAVLLPKRWYHFEFLLESGSNEYTMGAGRIFVKQNLNEV